jgi:phosphatidylinositol alpha-1,6-mannosyltransferase
LTKTIKDMKVLALITDGFGGYGGIAQYNRDILTAMACCANIDEVVALPRSFQQLEETPAHVTIIRSRTSRSLYSLNAIHVALRRRPFGAIFCGHLYMAPLAALIARMTGAPLWVQVHGLEAWKNPGRSERSAIETARVITSVSRFTKRRLLNWIDVEHDRIKVLPNTFDPSFRPGPKSAELLKRYGMEGRKILLTVSRLEAGEPKGQDLVIRQLSKIRLEHPNVIYLVIGEGSGQSALERVAAECGVADSVRFLGRIPANDLPEHMKLADVFVMPSLCEGFGIVFLEAIVSGIQVVAGNKDGSVDPLCDGAAGLLVDPLDGIALRKAIVDALSRSSPMSAVVERFARPQFQKHVRGIVDAYLSPNKEDWSGRNGLSQQAQS